MVDTQSATSTTTTTTTTTAAATTKRPLQTSTTHRSTSSSRPAAAAAPAAAQKTTTPFFRVGGGGGGASSSAAAAAAAATAAPRTIPAASRATTAAVPAAAAAAARVSTTPTTTTNNRHSAIPPPRVAKNINNSKLPPEILEITSSSDEEEDKQQQSGPRKNYRFQGSLKNPPTTATAAAPFSSSNNTTNRPGMARPPFSSSTTSTTRTAAAATTTTTKTVVPNVARSSLSTTSSSSSFAGRMETVGSSNAGTATTQKRPRPGSSCSSGKDQEDAIDLCHDSDENYDDNEDDDDDSSSNGIPCQQQRMLERKEVIYIDCNSSSSSSEEEDEHDSDDDDEEMARPPSRSVNRRGPSVVARKATAAAAARQAAAPQKVYKNGKAAEDAICLSSDDEDDDDQEPRKPPAVGGRVQKDNKGDGSPVKQEAGQAKQPPPRGLVTKKDGAFSPSLASTNNNGNRECSDDVDMAVESMSTKQTQQTMTAVSSRDYDSSDDDMATAMEGVVVTPPSTTSLATAATTTKTDSGGSSGDYDSSDDEAATRAEVMRVDYNSRTRADAMQVDYNSSDDEAATRKEANMLVDTTAPPFVPSNHQLANSAFSASIVRMTARKSVVANSAFCASVLPGSTAPTLAIAAATGAAASAKAVSSGNETTVWPPTCSTQDQAVKKPSPKRRSSPRTVCSDEVQPKRPERPCPNIAGLSTGFPKPTRRQFFFPDDRRKGTKSVEFMEEPIGYEQSGTFDDFCALYDEYTAERPPQKEKQIEVWDLSLGGMELPNALSEVESMSSPLSFDEFGRPMREFTVATSDDEYLFRFRSHIQKSKVGDGAGLGAYLTFLGALKLKPGRQEKREQIIEQVERHFPPSTKTYEFTTADGFVAFMQMTGENLHGNNNKIYRPKKGVSSIVRGNIIKALNIKSPVGVLGIFTADDYEESNADFDQQHTIDLDRYGPFRHSDRKTTTHFDLKAFVFSQIPNEYPFEVHCRLRGEGQMIDISDDVTGHPHAEAVQHINMYVNETGHDIKLKQNVFIASELKDRVVKYFFLLPKGETMKKGQTIELLTNYFELYEPQRKRHLYSREHLHEGFISTPATDLEESLHSRRIALNVVETRLEECFEDGKSSLPGLYQLLDAAEALYWDTFLPIFDAIDKLQSSGDLQLVSPLQIVAMRRFHWLRWRLGKAVNIFQALIDADNQNYGDLDPRQGVIVELGKMLDAMKCHPFVYKEVLSDERFSILKQAVVKEALEEVCYVLEKTILKPLDEGMWCNVSRSLMSRLSMWIAKIWWPCEDENKEKQHSARMELKKEFLKEAADAAKAIRDAVQNGHLKDLEFTSGIHQEFIVAKFSYLLKETQQSSAFFLDHTVTPKCYRAMMAEQLAYWDACAMMGTPPEPWDAKLERDERFVMVKSEHGPDSIRELGSVPRSTMKENLDVNSIFYIVWQVAYVVDCFADGFLRKQHGDELLRVHCSVDELCEAVNVDRSLLDFCRDRGMGMIDSGFDEVCRLATQVEYIEKNRTTGKITNRTKNSKKMKSKSDKVCASAAAFPVESKSDLHVNLPRKRNPKPKSDKKHSTPVKRRALPSCRPSAKKIWEGAPTELMEPGELMEHGWPAGWRKELYERQSGGTKGDQDRYWFTPDNRKFRSLVEVKRYMAALEAFRDEEAAYRARKSFAI